MSTQRLGIVMHGVTGRMGMNQHLVRSIVAIRNQGGVLLGNGTRIIPDPLLIGRDPTRIEALAKAHGIERFGTNLDAALANRADSVFFDAGTTQMRPALLAQALRSGKHVYCEKPIATNLHDAIEVCRLAQASGLKHGAVQDKLFLPGLRKLDLLKRAGFFGRILSVRIEFGYWVFEGDLQPIQRPSWNYRKEDGGGIILDMVCHWRYVLDSLFGEVQAVSCLGATHIPQRWDEAGQRLRSDRRRRVLCDVPAERAAGRGDRRASQQLVGDTRASRRPRDLPRRRHAWLGGRGVAGLPRPTARDDAAPGVEPRRQAKHELHRAMARRSRRDGLRQRVQDPMGSVHPPCRRRRAVPLDAARRREGRATRRSGAAELARAALGRRARVDAVRCEQ